MRAIIDFSQFPRIIPYGKCLARRKPCSPHRISPKGIVALSFFSVSLYSPLFLILFCKSVSPFERNSFYKNPFLLFLSYFHATALTCLTFYIYKYRKNTLYVRKYDLLYFFVRVLIRTVCRVFHKYFTKKCRGMFPDNRI